MRIMLVSATEFEVMPTLDYLQKHAHCVSPGVFRINHHVEVGVMITGVGSIHTALMLGRLLRSDRVDIAVQMGVAGSFGDFLANGDVVEVVSDRFADLGVEEKDGTFTDVFEMGLAKADGYAYQADGILINNKPNFGQLPAVSAITINKVHGSALSIEAIRAKYNPQIESMEGAAFMLACLTEGVRFAQLRSISNRVEPRNRANWELEKAINNLNTFVLSWLSGQ